MISRNSDDYINNLKERIKYTQNEEDIAMLNCQLGLIFAEEGNWNESLKSYRIAEEMYKKNGFLKNLRETRLDIATVMSNLGEYGKAKEIFLSNLNYQPQSEIEALGYARAICDYGALLIKLEEWNAAREKLEEAKTLFEKLNDLLGISNVLQNFGILEMRIGNYEQSLDAFKSSHSIYIELGNESGVAETLGNMGLIWKLLGNYDEAVNCYQKSLAIFKRKQDVFRIGMTLSNLGGLYTALRKTEDAIELYKQALTYFTESNNSYYLALTKVNLGKLLSVKDIIQSNLYIKEAIAELNKLNAHKEASIAMNILIRNLT